MKKLLRDISNVLKKDFVFFLIPILFSLLSIIYSKYTEVENEYKIESTTVKNKIDEDLIKREVIKDRGAVHLNYINLYEKLLREFDNRKKYKNSLVENFNLIKEDSISKIIKLLNEQSTKISINMGENFVYSEDNFDFKIPNNKVFASLLETEYEQNQEFIKNLQEKKISKKYYQLENKLYTYITATSYSAKDSLNIFKHPGITLNYNDDDIKKLEDELKTKKADYKFWSGFYIFTLIVLSLIILLLIIISIVKKYFN